MLLLSFATFALGIAFLVLAERWRRADLPRLANADIAYQVVLTGVQRLAVWQTRQLQTGNLRGYMRAVCGVMVATIGSAMLLFDVVALRSEEHTPELQSLMRL